MQVCKTKIIKSQGKFYFNVVATGWILKNGGLTKNRLLLPEPPKCYKHHKHYLCKICSKHTMFCCKFSFVAFLSSFGVKFQEIKGKSNFRVLLVYLQCISIKLSILAFTL